MAETPTTPQPADASLHNIPPQTPPPPAIYAGGTAEAVYRAAVTGALSELIGRIDALLGALRYTVTQLLSDSKSSYNPTVIDYYGAFDRAWLNCLDRELLAVGDFRTALQAAWADLRTRQIARVQGEHHATDRPGERGSDAGGEKPPRGGPDGNAGSERGVAVPDAAVSGKPNQ